MTVQFKSAARVAKKVKLVVYGGPGVGKTLVGLSFPRVALIDMEGSADLYTPGDVIEGWGTVPPFDVIHTKTLVDVQEAIAIVRRDNGKTWDTLVIDPVTVLNQVLQDAGQMRAENRAAKYGRSADEATMTDADWGTVKRKTYSLMTDLVNLPVNVILTAHLKEIYETRKVDGKEVRTLIGVKADAEKKTLHWADFAFEMRAEKGKRTAECVKERGYFKLGQTVEGLHFRHFAAFVQGHSTGQTVIQGSETEAARVSAPLLEDAAPVVVAKFTPPAASLAPDDAADIDEAEGYSQGDDAPAAAYPDVELPADIPTIGPRFFETVNAHRAQLGRAPYDALYGLQRVLSDALPDGFNWNMLRDEGARVLAYRAAMAHVRSSEKQVA